MENIKQLSSDYSNLIIGDIASGKTWRTAELIKDTINKGHGALVFESLGLRKALNTLEVPEDKIVTVNLSDPSKYTKFSFKDIAGSFCSKEQLKESIYKEYNRIIWNAGDLINEVFNRSVRYIMVKAATAFSLLDKYLSFKDYINLLVDAEMMLQYEYLFKGVKEPEKAETFEIEENKNICKAYYKLKEKITSDPSRIEKLEEKIHSVCIGIPDEIMKTYMDDTGLSVMDELKQGNIVLIHLDSVNRNSVHRKLLLDFETLLYRAFSMQSVLGVKFNSFIDDDYLCEDNIRLLNMMMIPLQMHYSYHECHFNLTVYPYTNTTDIKHLFSFPGRIIKLKDNFDYDILDQTDRDY